MQAGEKLFKKNQILFFQMLEEQIHRSVAEVDQLQKSLIPNWTHGSSLVIITWATQEVTGEPEELQQTPVIRHVLRAQAVRRK